MKRKTNEKFAKEFKEKRPDLEQLSFYVNSYIKIKVKSKKCRHEWSALPHNLLRGTGCPKCAKIKFKSIKHKNESQKLTEEELIYKLK